MKQVTLNIPDNKYPFFMELIKNLGLEEVKKKLPEANQKALKGLEQGFKEVRLMEEGKMKGTTMKEFLDEL